MEQCKISSFSVLSNSKILVYAVPLEGPGLFEYTLCTTIRVIESGDLCTWQIVKLLSFLEVFNLTVEVSDRDNCQVMSFSYLDAFGKEIPVNLMVYRDHTSLSVNGVYLAFLEDICKEIAKQEERERNIRQ